MSATKFAFTICSNNYLGQANALKGSFLKHNPDFQFYIFLVDKYSDEVDYKIFEPSTIVPIEEVDSIDLPNLLERYEIIELNTSVKPSAFKYIISENPKAEVAYYLDPDLYFYSSLEEANLKLASKSVILSPHILTPIPRDGHMPDENIFLRFGVYNLGFVGVNTRHPETIKMLDWWEERTIHHGWNKPHKGYFVDQLWMNFTPLFYKDVEVLNTYNYNMGPWNLHERNVVSRDEKGVHLNDGSRLVFYHFSKVADNDVDISREYNRYTLNDFPLLKEMYTAYKEDLKDSHFYDYKHIPIAYPIKALFPEKKENSFVSNILKRLSRIINRMADKV